MSVNKDTWAVEAQFNSEDFDKNIRKSQKHLEDFKEALNFDDAVKQMRDVTEQGTPLTEMISNMASNVNKLAQEMTGIGSLSTYVAQKIKSAWQGAMHSVEGFVKSLTTVQRQQGEQKYEGLLKSVQTIKNATGDTEEYVYQVMSTLNKYTDETSYNFSDMASNIGKFTTAGVKLGDAEKEMEGIANWAALAGQGVNEAQRAMYNISQAMSSGYMKLMDYRSIQNANMDIRQFRNEALKAAAAVGALTEKNGKYYAKKAKANTKTSTSKKNKKKADADEGLVEVNIDNFTDTLQYGWFNREAMENVFKVFGDSTKGIGEQAYKAAQRCVTLTDALNAVKDMLSTGWMNTYQHIFGKLTDAMNLFSGMCNKVSEALSQFVETRNKILEKWSLRGRNSLWGALVGEIETPDGDTLFKGAYGILDALVDIGDSVMEAFWNFVRRFVDPANLAIWDSDENFRFNYLGVQLATLTERVQNFTNSIRDFMNGTPNGGVETRADKIRNTIEGVFGVISMIWHVIKEVGRFGGEILRQLQPTFDAIGSLISYLAQLIAGDAVKESKQNKLGIFLHQLAVVLQPVTTIINKVVTVLSVLIAKIAEVGSKTGLTGKILLAIPFVKILSHFTLFGNKLGLIGKVLGALSFLKVGKEILSFAKDTEVFKKIAGKSSGSLGKFWNTIKTVFNTGNIKALKVLFQKKLGGLFKSFPTALTLVKKHLSDFAGKVGGVFEWVVGKILGLFETPAKAENVSDQVGDLVVRSLVPGGNNPVSQGTIILNQIKDGFTKFFKPISDWFTNFFNTSIPNFLNSNTMKAVKNFFSGTTFMETLTSFVQLRKWTSIGKIGSGLWSFGKGVKQIGKGLKAFGKGVKNWNFANIFKDMFNITNTINSNNQTKNSSIELGKFGSQLLQIAAAVAVLIYSAKQLMDLINKDPDTLKVAGIAIAGLLGGLILAGVAAKYLAGNGTSLLAIAAGVTLLVHSLGWLFKMKTGEFVIAGIKLTLLMGALAGCMRLATGGGNDGKRQLKGVIGFALGMLILMAPLKILAKDAGADWWGILKLGLVMAEIAGLSYIMSKVKFNGFKGMVGFALAMTIMLIPIKSLAKMGFGSMIKGLLALGALMLAIGLFARSVDKKQISRLAGLVGALAALSLIGWLIGKTTTWDQALVGFVPLLALLGMMALFINKAGSLEADKIKAIRSVFTSFSVMVGIITAAIILLNEFQVKQETIISFFAGLVLILAAMDVAVGLAKKGDSKAISALALVFVAVGAVAGIITAALIMLTKNKVDWNYILVFMGMLSAVILIAGLMAKLLSNMSPGGVLTAAVGIAGVIAAAMLAVTIMAPIMLGSIGRSLADLSARLKLTSGLLIDFFSKIDKISTDSVDHAKAVFDKLKDLMGSFTGFGQYEADIYSVMAQMLYLGTGLDLFFLNDSKYPDPDSSPTFATLNKLVEISPNLSTISFGNLPSELMYLGVGLNLFNTATNSISNGNPPSLTLLGTISDMAKNGFGTINKSFSTNLMYLGVGMNLFDTSTNSISNTNPPALTVLKSISDMAKAGFGNINKDFSANLMYLGVGLGLFSTSTRDITSAESPAIKLLGAISQMAKDGIGTFDAGISAKLMYLGVGLGLFNRSTSGITTSEPAVIGLLTNLFGQADNINKFAQLPINTLTSQMSGLGGAMSLYAQGATEVTGLKGKDLPDTAFAVEILKSICQSISGEDGTGALTIPENLPKEGDLGLFAGQLSALAMALSSFANAANEFKGNSADQSIALLTILGQIGGYLTPANLEATKAFEEAGISGGGATDKTSPLAIFALDIGALGSALAEFASLTTNTVFDSGLGALTHLSEINDKVNASSLAFASVFTNEKLSGNGSKGTGTPLGNFALDIGALGSALNKFSTLTKNTLFNGSLGALDKFGKLNQTVTATNLGFVKVIGNAGLSGNGSDGTGTPLGIFALDVGALGSALESFSTLTKNTSFNGSLGALDHLGDLNSKVTKDALAFTEVFKDANLSGGGSQESSGTPLGIFALDVGALGTALSSFNELTDNKVFDNGLGALDKLSDLNQKLKKDNLGFVDAFLKAGISGNGSTGTGTPLGKFAIDIGQLGHALGSFAQNMVLENGQYADFDKGIAALNMLTTMQARIPDPSGLLAWFTGRNEQFGQLGTQLQLLGQGLHDFSAKLTDMGDGNSGINMDAVQNGLDAIAGFIDVMNVLGRTDPTTHSIVDLTDAFQQMTGFLMLWSGNAGMAVDGEYIANGFVKIAQDISKAFDTVGGINATNLSMFRDLMSGIGTLAMLDPSLDFEYPGQMIDEGIARGVEQGKSKVVQAIVGVVQAAIDAGNKTADISSPSKVFEEMAMFMDLGLVEGFKNGTDQVTDASGDAVQSAIDNTSTLMAAISQAMSEEIDFQPSISPVLDLSGLRGAGSAVNGLFGTPYGLNLTAALEKANSATNQNGPVGVYVQNQNDLTPITQSLTALQEQVSALSESISKMQVVLNTGVVAGGITDDVDRNLGRKSLYASRRN